MTTVMVERKLEEVNRTQLASELGLSRVFVSQVLSGKKEPSLKVSREMAKRLGLTLDDFASFLQNAAVN